MAAQWLVYEVSNLVLNRWNEADMRFLHRKFHVFNDFNEAKSCMKKCILAYASPKYGMFDDDGNLKGLDVMCDLLLEYEMLVCKPGDLYRVDEFDNNSREFIVSLPAILRDYFTGKEDLHPLLSNFTDINEPIYFNAEVDFSYEEIDGGIELGSLDDLPVRVQRINITDAPYLTPATDRDTLPPRLSITSFNMNDPNRNYCCCVTGEYNII